jgi:hypothetical protein
VPIKCRRTSEAESLLVLGTKPAVVMERGADRSAADRTLEGSGFAT